MALLSSANFLAFTDKLGATWNELKTDLGSQADKPAVAGTDRAYLQSMLTLVVGLGDYEEMIDLLKAVNDTLSGFGYESACGPLVTAVNGLNTHCRSRGPEVDASIVGVNQFLSYYNGVSRYSALASQGFSELYMQLTGQALTPGNVMCRAISSLLNPTAQPNGMGTRAVGGSFTAGVGVDATKAAGIQPLITVSADFVGGTAAPQVVVAGVDDDNAGTTTWTLTLDSNNPASALSTTVTGSVTAQSRQTVAVGSSAGMAPGTVLSVNAGLLDQEFVIVESVPDSTHITAAFQKAHNAGAALVGRRTYTPPPSTAGKRVRTVTGITLNLTGHTGGAVVITGRQDRGVT